MRLVIAPASFKGSLSAAQAADALALGARQAARTMALALDLEIVPLADGGEGTVDAVRRARKGAYYTARARDPLMRPIDAGFLLLDDGAAVLEMAAASGLTLLVPDERDPLHASTHGTGDLMAAAAAAGARRLVIGVGGSATVDGGAGMAQALGIRLLDAEGLDLPPGGAALGNLAHVDVSGLAPIFRNLPIEVLCDVRNPLVGRLGAAEVFGPQKGAGPGDVQVLEAALHRLAHVVDRDLHLAIADLPAAGAAGGLAAGLFAFLGASLLPGIDVILDLLEFPGRLAGTDLVLTGEGQLDAQTSGGKVIAGLARLTAERGIPLVAIAGRVAPEARELYAAGLTAAFALADGPRSLDECRSAGAEMLARVSESVLRLWLSARN